MDNRLKMNKILTFVAALAAVACTAQPETLTLLVGTYTEDERPSEGRGVFLYSLNTKTLEATQIGVAQSGNPSFVIQALDGKTAYAVNEFNDGRQGVSSYTFSPEGVVLESSASIPKGGEDPCNILYTGDAIVTSNYTGGSMTAFAIKEDGSIGELTQTWAPDIEHASHIHCAVLSPDGKYIFVTDLGNDFIYRFERLSGTAPLGEMTVAWGSAAGSHFGPRHLTFSPDGKFAYLLCELGDKLISFRYDDGEFVQLQVIDAYQGEGHGSADIHLSPDGRFLYTSHRLKEDGVAVFAVDAESGEASPVGYQPTGIHPRNFTITPDGKLLLCACRDSDRIEIYSIDPETGLLKDAGKSIDLPAPVCVQIVQ